MAAPPKIPILVVVGTRPEAIKLVPLIVALRESESFRPVVVSTGQHQAMVLLGIRLIGTGWEGRQELRAVVEQQALPNLRRLLRQRTRWSQGNLQAMGLVGDLVRAPRLGLVARFDQVAHLLQPLFQGLIGLSLVAALGLAIFDVAPLWGDVELWKIVFIYLLGFGGVLLGCIARGVAQGLGGALKGVLIAHVYAFYSWLLWPVLIRATIRQLTDRRAWAKTEREPPRALA